MMDLIIAYLLGGYVIADGIVFLIVRKITLDYWRRKEPDQPALYSYVPLANIPMALYFKWTKGLFTGESFIAKAKWRRGLLSY